MTDDEAVVAEAAALGVLSRSKVNPSDYADWLITLARAYLALSAKCKAMERVIGWAQQMKDHESTWCLVTPPCGACTACLFNAALDALADEAKP